MGGFHSKKKEARKARSDDEKRSNVDNVRSLTEKIRLLREEINEMMHEREKERKGYERELMVFAFKEAEWKQERKKLREEVKRLRKNLEEKMRVMEEEDESHVHHGLLLHHHHQKKKKSSCHQKEWELLGTSFLVDQMREERARRDEAVEKWKHLYLAIKTELDNLIQTTHNGDGVYWRSAEEEEMIKELRMEVKDKEQSIEALKAQLASTEQEVYRRERDIDIVRQSLKIMSCNKKKPSRVAKRFTTRLHL
ncbi:hypothetical protein ACOSP7_006585 [Xanthoceras sorbifolium]|uniref:Uncharacterized protein n=1 Tax=Xanthoceras sorbifolium TaxID=99658 RepID=A0ABQ8I927_9ROSI|nr:hypothetical protein JRO89_XS03G0074800 [Xanthoceras sorbifolium]